jgi:hypothetical protein
LTFDYSLVESELVNTDLLASASRARAHVRAERGAGSLPLIVLGSAATLLGPPVMLDIDTDVVALAPTLAFLTLLIVVWVRGRRRGVGLGSDGYVFLAILGALMLLAIPVTMVVGGATVLGAGLVLLGIRGRDAEMSAAGLTLAVVGWLTMRPVSSFGETTDGAILAATGAALVVLGLIRVRSERRLLRTLSDDV